MGLLIGVKRKEGKALSEADPNGLRLNSGQGACGKQKGETIGGKMG